MDALYSKGVALIELGRFQEPDRIQEAIDVW